jgi:predicted glutamine amidotransferase
MQEDDRISPPGLVALTRKSAAERDALPAAGVTLETDCGPQSMTLFASVPLTDEDWRPLREGEIVMVREGERLASRL